MRCARCGNDNPGTNRFCGMCGATLLRPPVGGSQHPAPPVPPVPAAPPPMTTAPAAAPTPAASPAPVVAAREFTPVPAETPVISGPSFLGLNTPAPEPRRSSLSIDPNSAPGSKSLDYLLHDEDEPRSSGTVKFFLILMALALAVGLGYLRFKNQGLAWLKSNMTKPPAAQTSDAPDSAPAQPPASSTTPPASSPTTAPAASSATPTTSDPNAASTSSAPASAPADSAPATANPAPAPASGSAPTTDSTASPADVPAKPTKPPAPAKDTSDPNVVGLPVAKQKPVPTRPKPSIDPVTEAQNYLYGRGGVRQDCDRGLRILKPQADASNPKAMIEMGALYSAGLCTPRDLPTAYRWFAVALRKDPDNQAIQTDLQKLWGEMTQPERQLAIRLSQ